VAEPLISAGATYHPRPTRRNRPP